MPEVLSVRVAVNDRIGISENVEQALDRYEKIYSFLGDTKEYLFSIGGVMLYSEAILNQLFQEISLLSTYLSDDYFYIYEYSETTIAFRRTIFHAGRYIREEGEVVYPNVDISKFEKLEKRDWLTLDGGKVNVL